MQPGLLINTPVVIAVVVWGPHLDSALRWGLLAFFPGDVIHIFFLAPAAVCLGLSVRDKGNYWSLWNIEALCSTGRITSASYSLRHKEVMQVQFPVVSLCVVDFFFFFYTTRCDTFTHLSSLMGIECSFTNQLSSLLVANAVNWVVYLSPVSFPCLSKSEGGISVLLISLNKITLGLKWKGLWGPDCLVKARHGMNH